MKHALRLPGGRIAETWASLAWISLARGKGNQAYLRSRKALKLDVGCALAHLTQAVVLLDKNNYSGASTALQQAKATGPETGVVHFVQAQLCAATGDVAQARNEYQEAVNWPDVRPEIVYRELHALADNIEDRIECLEKILAYEPTNTAVSKRLIRLYLSAGHLDAARDKLERIQGSPGADTDARISMLWGDYHVLRRDLTQAIAAYEAASRTAPKWPDPFYRLGEVFSTLEQDDTARARYRDGRRLGKWRDRESPYEPILESDRADENWRAVVGEGLGPFQLVGILLIAPFFGMWTSLRQAARASRTELVYPLLAFAIAILYLVWNGDGQFFARGILSTLVVLVVFTGGGWVALRTLHLFFKQTLVVHPNVLKWSVLEILVSFPLLLPFTLGPNVICGASTVLAYGLAILLVAMGLSRGPLKPDRHTVRRILLVSFPIWLGSFALLVGLFWWVLRAWGFSFQSAATFENLFGLAMFGYMLALFALVLGTTALSLYVLVKPETGPRLLRHVLDVPLRRYRGIRHRFVKDWGFSPLYFNCILPLLTSLLLTGLANSRASLWWLVIPSWLLNLNIFVTLAVVYIDYTFSPRPFKHLKIDAIRKVLDISPRHSADVPLALVVMAGLFGAFWVNYSIALTNYGIVAPDSFVVPAWFKPNDLWSWAYVTFKLMVTGDFEIQASDQISQMIIAIISTSQFFFLGLFFSEIVTSLRAKREPG